ncbi:MAG: GntR family transcriptional regulator [Eubacteriaceae bacterium]|jgi:DNA-binding GntR family transcriptional regulator|nr:GntR family transcriptional regulator [Eubacteriaceae bacterium]
MVKIKSLSDQVYDYIINQIKTGKLAYGAKVNENKLIEELNISRTPIREALIQLASDNVLDNISRKGFFVKSYSDEEVDEIYSVVGILDSNAIKLAIPHLKSAHLKMMRFEVEKMAIAIKEKNYEMYTLSQEEFHSIYLEQCHNSYLIALVKDIWKKSLRTTYYSLDQEELFKTLTSVNEEHLVIIDLIEKKDIEGAGDFVYKHWSEHLI